MQQGWWRIPIFASMTTVLRMILVIGTPELAEALAQRLADAAANGALRMACIDRMLAMMTCFTPSVMRSDHVRFHRRRTRRRCLGCDGAEGDGGVSVDIHAQERPIRICFSCVAEGGFVPTTG